MILRLLQDISKSWLYLVLCFVIIDIFVVGGLLYFFAAGEAERVAAAELARVNATPTPSATPTATATLWPGPGRRVTPTPTGQPTAFATDVLAESGFAPGFTPTPRPTREPVKISLPIVAPVFAGSVDVPIINQINYPEPFFPPGTNNACGPVALFAALHALGARVNYGHLRSVAVNNGFTSYGISKAGMIRTLATINSQLGSPYTIEYGNHYATKDLIKHIRQGGVAIVLLRVRREYGRYVVTADRYNSVGHFLIVERINMRSKTVQFAGSTLGMTNVRLDDFMRSWSSNPQAVTDPAKGWQKYLRSESASNWALIIKGQS
jgi:hypothetical protein